MTDEWPESGTNEEFLLSNVHRQLFYVNVGQLSYIFMTGFRRISHAGSDELLEHLIYQDNGEGNII